MKMFVTGERYIKIHLCVDAVAQLEERYPDTVEVIGSSPVSITIFYLQKFHIPLVHVII